MKEKTIICANGHAYIRIITTDKELYKLEKCEICGKSTTNVWRDITRGAFP